MSPSRKASLLLNKSACSEQHKLAVELLKALGMEHVRSERVTSAGYRYYAWRRPKKAKGETPDGKADLLWSVLTIHEE